MQISAKTKLMSLFVLGFLCLNTAGIVCLAYCRTAMASAPADHCPLKKMKGAHCPSEQKASESNSDAFEIRTASCCVMPIGMFAAPLEAKQGVAPLLLTAILVEKATAVTPVASATRKFIAYTYRPPPKDRRGERILHNVFRI